MSGDSSGIAGRTEWVASKSGRIGWNAVRDSLTQPYRVTASMVVLVSLVPLYIFIADAIPKRAPHVPALPLDRIVPLRPAWTVVYAALYLFVIILPVFVVRQEEQIRRTVRAYLLVWITAFFVFLAYPTTASRPLQVIGDGFALWSLRFLYSLDPPYNCFPSLHVAHSFVSALTCYRVHRGVGVAAGIAASLIGVSTLFTRQHYIADVIAGSFLALVAYFAFLRGYRRDAIPDLERRLAPVLAFGIAGFIGVVLGAFWIAYRVTGK
ncbi:MAG TPA: phosphatase PAP2 family protein [Thermoanaerobaculia bacterium]|jgi:membrane-associated phospholipid phosphatase|nr:phosphatase PAP2 family protein [Thermoanaerobaculia bacterium]